MGSSRAKNFPKPILIFICLTLGGDVGVGVGVGVVVVEGFFDKQIPDCAKGGIHAGAKLGSFVFLALIFVPYDSHAHISNVLV